MARMYFSVTNVCRSDGYFPLSAWLPFDRLPHLEEIRCQCGLLASLHAGSVDRKTHPGQEDKEDHDNQQLDEREAARLCTKTSHRRRQARSHRRTLATLHHASYQSRYFVPSSAVPSLLVYTSKTFCPPHVVASGSS